MSTLGPVHSLAKSPNISTPEHQTKPKQSAPNPGIWRLGSPYTDVHVNFPHQRPTRGITVHSQGIYKEYTRDSYGYHRFCPRDDGQPQEGNIKSGTVQHHRSPRRSCQLISLICTIPMFTRTNPAILCLAVLSLCSTCALLFFNMSAVLTDGM